VDARHITLATLASLLREKKVKPELVQKAIQEMEIDPEKVNPLFG
jgi:pyruvate dehydrogenase E1 component